MLKELELNHNWGFHNSRNESLDLMRGLAALLVISGHVIQLYVDAGSNILYNLITAIQMPLFMLVAGYAQGYSKPIIGVTEFFGFIKKRAIQLLIPWAVWSILFYLTLSHRPLIEWIIYAAYHMESAYWFLFSLFWINVQFGIADLISNKFLKKYELVVVPILCLLSTSVLLYIGSLVGISFLGIKYTTYYMLFFIMGWAIKEIKYTYLAKYDRGAALAYL